MSGSDFVYTTDIPNAPHDPSADQPIMEVNTNSINGILDVDHYGFNDNHGGIHRKSTYPAQGSNPSTDSGEIAVFGKTGPSGTELFMIRDNVAGTLTNLTTSKVAAPVVTANGYSWLPGGILVQWGIVNKGSSSSGSVSFNTAFLSVVNIQITLIGSSSSTNTLSVVSISIGSPGSFAWHFTGSSSYTQFYWMAIGT